MKKEANDIKARFKIYLEERARKRKSSGNQLNRWRSTESNLRTVCEYIGRTEEEFYLAGNKQLEDDFRELTKAIDGEERLFQPLTYAYRLFLEFSGSSLSPIKATTARTSKQTKKQSGTSSSNLTPIAVHSKKNISQSASELTPLQLTAFISRSGTIYIQLTPEIEND